MQNSDRISVYQSTTCKNHNFALKIIFLIFWFLKKQLISKVVNVTFRGIRKERISLNIRTFNQTIFCQWFSSSRFHDRIYKCLKDNYSKYEVHTLTFFLYLYSISIRYITLKDYSNFKPTCRNKRKKKFQF